MMKIYSLLLLLVFPSYLSAQTAADFYGGWIVDEGDKRHIYYIVLRDSEVSGTYCFNCDNPANLAFIDDGSFDEDGLRFTLYHSPADSLAYTEEVVAELIEGKLHLSIVRAGTQDREMVLHRTLPEDIIPLPMPDSTTNSQVGTILSNRDRVLPGPAQVLVIEDVVGLWLWGTGPAKQNFMFKRHKGGLRGMVCGPCNSAPDMAPLEGIVIEGENLHFEIVHEDNGMDIEIYGPHSNVTEARISKHEMHMDVTPSFEEPGFSPIEMTLLGPIRD